MQVTKFKKAPVDSRPLGPASRTTTIWRAWSVTGLEEADEVDRQTRTIDPETREYKLGEAETRTRVKVDVPKNNGATEEAEKKKATNERKSKSKSKTGDTGKAPDERATKKDAPKDTQEAAAQMLRKFFNRG